MTLPLYMDHNVKAAITAGIRRHGLDAVTALEDGHDQKTDDELLARVSELNRVVFTQDADFIQITGDWLAEGRDFSGVVFAD